MLAGYEKELADLRNIVVPTKGQTQLDNKPSQLGKLIIFIRKKMAHKGENYSVKLQKYYFCTRTHF